MGIGPLLGLLKTAATNIPWAKVAQNTPLVVDAFGKAKARLQQNEALQKDLEHHLKALHEENARLTSAVLQLSDKLQLVTSRVSLLSKISAVSLLLATASLALWIFNYAGG